MSLPSASTLKIDGHIKNLGLTSTCRRDVLIHGQGIDQEPDVTDAGRNIHLEVGGSPLGGAAASQRLVLTNAVQWSLVFDGVGSWIRANLSGLDLGGLELDGVFSNCSFDLPVPTSPVRIVVDGVVRGLSLRRPAGVPVTVSIDGPARKLDLGSAILADGAPASAADMGVGYEVIIDGPVWNLTISEA